MYLSYGADIFLVNFPVIAYIACPVMMLVKVICAIVLTFKIDSVAGDIILHLSVHRKTVNKIVCELDSLHCLLCDNAGETNWC